jgi:ATP adenylyltransferase
MHRLFSPWRLAYVTGAAGSGPSSDCFLCDAAGATPDPERAALVVARGLTAYVILNLYPYNNGHLLVVPNRHVATLAAANEDELSEIMRLTRVSEMALTEAYQPHGINVGMNLGRPAGAGVADHLHVHLVPRWNGDTSFISVIGETRVLPETLPDTAARLRPIFQRLVNPPNC